MNNKIELNTELSIGQFMYLVNEIAEGYFYDGEDSQVLNMRRGEYAPHIGLLNTMRLFYNNCLTGDGYGVEHDITDALLMKDFIHDEDFVRMFNEAINGDGDGQIDFANAFGCAMKIVEAKLNSNIAALDKIKNSFVEIIDKLVDVINNLDVEALSKLFSSDEEQ